MYKGFSDLQTRPFAKSPDPQFLYFSQGHREANARLQHAIEKREMILLTGGIEL